MKQLRTTALSALALGALALTAATDRETGLMAEVEQVVRLPEGAAPLDQYVRHYSYLGDGTVIGIYVRPDMTQDEQPGRAWVETGRLPRISGGGCGVVTVFYNPRTKAAPDSRCNFSE